MRLTRTIATALAGIALALATSRPAEAQPLVQGIATRIRAAADCTAVACVGSGQVCISGTTLYTCDTGAGFYTATGSATPSSLVATGTTTPPILTVDANDRITSDITPDSSPRFSYGNAWDNATASTIPNGYLAWTYTIDGALTDPVEAPSLANINGALPIDTYHIKFSWRGRYSSPTVANGATDATTSYKALTAPGPEVVGTVTSTSDDGFTVTIPAYPDNAVGADVFCNRDGDAIPEWRRCTTINRPSTSGNVTTTVSWAANTEVTTNNTVDRTLRSLGIDGWDTTDNAGAWGIHAVTSIRPTVDTGPTAGRKAWTLGPDLAYSYDGGATVFGSVRDSRYDVPACGWAGKSLADTVAMLDGTTGPNTQGALGTSTRARIVMRGDCATATTSWITGLDLTGTAGSATNPASGIQTIDLTNVEDVTISNVTNLRLTGSSCKRIHVKDSIITGNTDLDDCEDVVFEGVRLSGKGAPTNATCGTIQVNGGTYVIKDSDLTCHAEPGDNPTAVAAAIIIGQWADAGVVSAQSVVTISNNVMGPREDTTAGLIGFIDAYYDTTATASELYIIGNTIVHSTGGDTDCVGVAPQNGGLITISSGADSSAGFGRVRVVSAGNRLSTIGCEKGNVFRISEMDDDLSTFYSIGDSMFADTTGIGTDGLDDDTHCIEWAGGMPRMSVVRGGTCVNKNDATGFVRPFWIHTGAPAAGQTPTVYIEDYYIESRSTNGSVAANTSWGIGNSANTAAVPMYVTNVTIDQALVTDADYVDLYIDANAIAAGSRIIVANSDYSFDDVTGPTGIRIRNDVAARVTAPAICTIGDSYRDTSGALCYCTAANTWTNISGVGACT